VILGFVSSRQKALRAPTASSVSVRFQKDGRSTAAEWTAGVGSRLSLWTLVLCGSDNLPPAFGFATFRRTGESGTLPDHQVLQSAGALPSRLASE
jgi:hypothetical protein